MWRNSRFKFNSTRFALVGCAAIALTACSQADDGSSYGTSEEASVDMAVSEPAYPAAADIDRGEMSALDARPDIPVNVPKMAYVYDYGFRVPGERISALQLRHADMCEAMGPYSCQIVAMNHTGGDEYVAGTLSLAVASDKARAFVGDVTATLDGVEGEQVRANISGEDLSKQMVDTEARLRSRIMLRDRLMEVLRTRQGEVSELVEAERSVARINEEIDQARSWMEEMQGRVAFSRVNLSYESATPVASDFFGPVKSAVSTLDSLFGNLLAILVFLTAIGIPLGLIALGIRKAKRIWATSDPAEA